MSLADHVRGWSPGPVERVEVLDGAPADAFAGLLDQPSPTTGDGGALPPLWTAFHFLDRTATHELGADGHPADGHFLPPLPHRRRMFAGGRLTVHAPLRFGDEVVRRSALASVTPKTGASGELLFVTLVHEYRRGGTLLQVEEQDLVYRTQEPGVPRPAGAPAAGAPAAGEHAAPWRLELTPDEVLLFRFSALTANAHRIHYDLPYTRDVEGFPGLVVHGPLLALLLLELPRRFAPGRPVTRFAYRLRRPAFAGARLVARGGTDGGRLACGGTAAEPGVTGVVGFGGPT